jgi:hypothetical protein
MLWWGPVPRMNSCFSVLATGTMGESLNQRGVKKLFVLANYAVRKDMVAGVKQTFKGEVVGEEYTRWPGQLDFSTELSKVRTLWQRQGRRQSRSFEDLQLS